jgi:hypothetical protein
MYKVQKFDTGINNYGFSDKLVFSQFIKQKKSTANYTESDINAVQSQFKKLSNPLSFEPRERSNSSAFPNPSASGINVRQTPTDIPHM